MAVDRTRICCSSAGTNLVQGSRLDKEAHECVRCTALNSKVLDPKIIMHMHRKALLTNRSPPHVPSLSRLLLCEGNMTLAGPRPAS
jgi:hypothetical protein